MKDMFCFQCQQTAHNTGCDGKVGVCGKKADTAVYQDELIGALIALANAAEKACHLAVSFAKFLCVISIRRHTLYSEEDK